jgi:archaellum component FlaD/FlaE
MSEGDINQNREEKILEEFEFNAELRNIINQCLLPPRIAQKIGEKLKEKNIKITKNQLYRLVEKLQIALQSNPSQSSNQSEHLKRTENISLQTDEKKICNDAVPYTMDMKKLVETVDHLSERLKAIEGTQLEGVKGASGHFVKTKDIKNFEPDDIFSGEMRPLEQTPNDPESIVVIMKWLQYLVEKIGKNNLPDVLGYYVDIGWISDDVRLDLISYSKGIIEEPIQTGGRPSHLPTRDHLQSLLFIQKLKGVQLDDRFLGKIERDMEKIIKSLEGYPLK